MSQVPQFLAMNDNRETLSQTAISCSFQYIIA